MKTVKAIYRHLRITILRILVLIYQKPLPDHDNILIISPHPDDEIFGCGGLIIRQIKKNKKVSVIILTGGEASHAGCCNINTDKLKEKRKKLSLEAAKITKTPQNDIYFMNFTDGNINKKDNEIEQLEKIIKKINPDAVFFTNAFEGWSDHIISGEIIKELLANKNTELFEYCVWLWFNMPIRKIFKIHWKKTQIIKLTNQEIELKNKSIDCYIFPKSACGRPYSGSLPKVFIQSNRWKKELYFKVK